MSDSLPFGVPVAVLAEIVEVDALVRISLCPDRVVGLCPYHRAGGTRGDLGNTRRPVRGVAG